MAVLFAFVMDDIEQVRLSSSGMAGSIRRQGSTRTPRRSSKRRFRSRSCENRGSSSCVVAAQGLPSCDFGWPGEMHQDPQSLVAEAQDISEGCILREQDEVEPDDISLTADREHHGPVMQQDLVDGGLELLPSILYFCNSHALLRMGAVRKSWAELAWQVLVSTVMQCPVSVQNLCESQGFPKPNPMRVTRLVQCNMQSDFSVNDIGKDICCLHICFCRLRSFASASGSR